MASGDTLAVFFPRDGEPPASAYATLDTRNVVVVADYDDTTDENMEFAGFMPRHYTAAASIVVTVGWMATSATSGTISLDISFKSVSDDADDLDTKAFATALNVNPTTANASGEVDYISKTFTSAEADAIAPGEYFRMKITRDADGTTSTDDLSGDMELVFVEIREA